MLKTSGTIWTLCSKQDEQTATSLSSMQGAKLLLFRVTADILQPLVFPDAASRMHDSGSRLFVRCRHEKAISQHRISVSIEWQGLLQNVCHECRRFGCPWIAFAT